MVIWFQMKFERRTPRTLRLEFFSRARNASVLERELRQELQEELAGRDELLTLVYSTQARASIVSERLGYFERASKRKASALDNDLGQARAELTKANNDLNSLKQWFTYMVKSNQDGQLAILSMPFGIPKCFRD